MSADNPILNNPYTEPLKHYDTDSNGGLDYEKPLLGRRIFKEDTAVLPARQKAQKEVFEWNNDATSTAHLINLCRKEVGFWRAAKYPNTTRITKELLDFWFNNPDRLVTKKLFFAQQEAIETAIWLNEVAEKSNAGTNILNMLRSGQNTVSNIVTDQLPRIAFKMATGSGKTVVMACLICYHYFNRREYVRDTRFVDYFLIIAPGVTIKSRLGVLFVDTKNENPNNIEDYYRVRGLIPPKMEVHLKNLNAKLVITNYHTFEAKALQGNKKSPFDGKTNLEGKKIDTGNKEDFGQVVKRILSKFKLGSRVLILNDEAHHCYLPKSKSKTTDNEGVDENARAAVWFSGIREIAKKFKVHSIYDLSATPYYLTGSGHTAYSLFPWVVSDFGLIEAIESGLVKIPFLPESDDTQELTTPILKDLYSYVKKDLPKKGRTTAKKEAKKKGEKYLEEKPNLPSLVKNALDQFYSHYVEYFEGNRKKQEEKKNIFSSPPVFIVVCNNTGVSKEVYKYIAGYEYEDEEKNMKSVPGAKELFSNYDPTYNKLLKKPPTLLIDSDALENGEQVNDDFKKIFSSEIDAFKKDYAHMYGQGSTDKISDAQILREVVNTVGRQGKLGAHIRCVVSVSMLTEGWDTNTVTHIMGLRAFGSQLLCEQVAGRALRRMSYHLQGYDKDGNLTDDKRKIVIEKFPPEYAHIIGIPFKMFKSGKNEPPPTPIDFKTIMALPEKAEMMEITFPNVVGYRVENIEGEIKYDFSGIENYVIDGSKIPTKTIMTSAISAKEENLELTEVMKKRDNEIVFYITKELIKYKFSDEEYKNPLFHKFNKLKNIVAEWYNTKITVLNHSIEYKKLVYFEDSKKLAEHIARGINPQLNTSEHIRPLFNFYNKFGSTKYVKGKTIKEVYPTKKSHVNFVVMDSEWEGICAKTLEELESVQCYVKNQFLDFTIPYNKNGEDHLYLPDFIAKIKTKNGTIKNIIIEITGEDKNQDKAEKKWFVENRWLPAVNALKEKYQYPEWHFIEVANDIRDIRNQLIEKINTL